MSQYARYPFSNGILSINGDTAANQLIVGGSGITVSTTGGTTTISSTGGTGTVTSVGLSLPGSVFTVSGSPVTTSGTLTGSFNTQSIHTVFSGPSSGGPSAPTFRLLTSGDIPPLPYALDSFTIMQTPLGTSPTASSSTDTLTFANTDGTLSITGNSVSKSITFNTIGLQPAGNYITALTGDVTATGPGSVPATLATVNSSPGTYTYATLTVNSKGLVTSASSGISPVTSVTAAGPIISSGGATPSISIGVLNTANILYVSHDLGNDSTGDGSFAHPYFTIQKAIGIAQARPSTYNTPIKISVAPSGAANVYAENLSITQQGIILEAASSVYHNNSVILYGNHTINLTGTAGDGNFYAGDNEVSINGFQLAASNGSPIIDFTGSVLQRLFLNNCILYSTGTNSAITVESTGNSGGSFSTVTVRDCDFTNGSASVPTIKVTSGNIFIAGANPSVANTTSGGPAITNSGTKTVTLNNGSVTGTVSNSSTGSIILANSAIAATTTGGVISNTSTGSVIVEACAVTNNTSTGSGIVESNAAGTVTAAEVLFNIGTGSGAYVAKGTGVYVYAANAYVSNKNLQNTLTIVPLATTPTTGP